MFRQLLTYTEQQFLKQRFHDQLFFPNINQFVTTSFYLNAHYLHIFAESVKPQKLITYLEAMNEKLKAFSSFYLQNPSQFQIKVQPINNQKSLTFSNLITLNLMTQQFQFQLQMLQDVKEQKIKFISTLKQTDQDRTYVEMSQSPVMVDNFGCDYFLLNAYCSTKIDRHIYTQRNSYKQNYTPNHQQNYAQNQTKNANVMNALSKLMGQRQNQNRHQSSNYNPLKMGSDNNRPPLSLNQQFYNLLYMISYWMYVPQQMLQQFVSSIRKQSSDCINHTNRLFVVNSSSQQVSSATYKKNSGRISTTAAETKMGYQHQLLMESDIFFEQQVMNGLTYERGSNNRMTLGKQSASTPKNNMFNTTNNGKGHYGVKNDGQLRGISVTNNNNNDKNRNNNPLLNSNNQNHRSTQQTNASRCDKYFSRIHPLQQPLTQISLFKKMLQEIQRLSQSTEAQTLQNQHYFTYRALEKLFMTLQQNHYLLSSQQFHDANDETIASNVIQKLFANYTFSLEQQFNIMDEKSIDDIKELLDKLYQRILTQFYQAILIVDSIKRSEQKSLQQLLALINNAQKSLFASINKSKREMFERKLCIVDDIHVCDRQPSLGYDRRTKFESVLGENLVQDQQIGFGLYRESIKSKMNDIFDDLLDESGSMKKTLHHKSLPSANKNNIKESLGSKLISRHAITNNMDKRIEILLSQKRNLQQSLHYEERLQENLIEYMNGQSSYHQQKRQRREIETISQSEEEDQ